MKGLVLIFVFCFSVLSMANPPETKNLQKLDSFMGRYEVMACSGCEKAQQFLPLKGELVLNSEDLAQGSVKVTDSTLKYKSTKDGVTDKIKIERVGDHYTIYRQVSKINLFGTQVGINYVLLANHPQ